MTSENTARWCYGGQYAAQAGYSWSQCRYCGRAQDHDCKRVVCMLCESPQCHGNGSGDGRCRVCHYGYLPGWSRIGRETCSYKGCGEPAIAMANRTRRVCTGHADQAKIRMSGNRSLTVREYAAEQIMHRDSGKGWQSWRLVA